MSIKVKIPDAPTSGIQNILGMFGKIGGAASAGSTVKGWLNSPAATSGGATGAETTAMPEAGAGMTGLDAAGADAAAGGGADAVLALSRGGLVPGKARILSLIHI